MRQSSTRPDAAPAGADEYLVGEGAGEVERFRLRYPALDSALIRIVIADHGPVRANVDNVLYLFQNQKYRDPLENRV